MPFYDFKCGNCGFSEERWYPTIKLYEEARDNRQTPRHCERPMGRVYNAAGVDYQTKGYFPRMVDDLGPEPVRVESVKDLRAKLKERGLYERPASRALSDKGRWL